MNNIIISGATGYFGSLAKKYLEASTYKVLTAGKRASADIFFDLDKPSLFAQTNCDAVVDCFIHAAAVNEVVCVNNPYAAVYQNVASTRAALDFCVKNGIKKFIYLSTFHVYGVDSGLVDEDTEVRSMHDYGLTHLQAEEYVRMYTRKGLIQGVSLRPANMFDVPVNLYEFNRWSLIPFGFCKSAVDDGEIVLKTAGFQQRNFVSVKDIIRVTQMVMDDDMNYDVINVPGPSVFSIREFAELVKSVMNSEFEQDISVKAPPSIAAVNSLDYISKYISPSSMGFCSIEAYVKEMCAALIRDKGRMDIGISNVD